VLSHAVQQLKLKVLHFAMGCQPTTLSSVQQEVDFICCKDSDKDAEDHLLLTNALLELPEWLGDGPLTNLTLELETSELEHGVPLLSKHTCI
jgi:hypothetical protein